MNAFQWLVVLGFPADIAAACAMPGVFASSDAITANALALRPEHREPPAATAVFVPAGA